MPYPLACTLSWWSGGSTVLFSRDVIFSGHGTVLVQRMTLPPTHWTFKRSADPGPHVLI